MKRLLVLLLCAVLAVPAVGMNVQATEPQVPIGDTNVPNTVSENEKEKSAEQSADQVAMANASVLNDYLKNKKFTDAEMKKADEVMKKAAEALGLSYDETNHKLSDGPTGTIYETADGVVDYVKSVKEELDNCKTKEVVQETPTESETETVNVNSNIIVGGKEYDTTTANAGQQCEIAVPLVNLGDTKVTNVVITPVLSSDVTAWPFDIEKTDYSQTCDKLRGEDSGKSVVDRKHTFRWTLKTRDDAITGYTKLTFNVTYNEADGSKGSVALDYYVQVNGVEPTDENGKLSTPRVIVTGFTTTPEEVYAGDTFTLTLNLKNTSKTTAVSNMLFDIQGTQEGTDSTNTYAAFLPTAGSSTIYVDSIGANSTKSISIELKSKADLAQKPYVVTVNMEYEDSEANPFTEVASVSVPIKQEPKVDISSVTLMPETIEIGNEANVMFSIYNVGKTKLYNVNVKFEADSISGGDTFIGNLEPGATGNVDAYLAGQAATMDDGTVKIIIRYEDEEGKEATIEKTMTLYVNEPYYEEFYEDPMMMGDMEEEKGLPWWGIALIAVGAAAAAVAAVVVIKKKKKAKKLAQEELEAIEAAELLEDNSLEE
ncbi:MAG: hypothetical protein U0M69_01885 [Lachnospiraceae bacterium]|nr:hypothetical protein [Lachnospiraceae bacterium]